MFLIGCMGARFGLAYLAYKAKPKYLSYMSFIGFYMFIAFSVIYINGWRKTGIEVNGEKIWWNALRPIHASLWYLFTIKAIAKDKDAWIAILIDTLLGLTAFLIHYSAL